MFGYLDEALAIRAIHYVLPAIQAMMADGVTSRSDLHIMVFNRSSGFIVAQHTLGDPATWDEAHGKHHFDEIAARKGWLSVRTGMSSREVQYMHPEMLVAGDTKFFGSVVYGDIVVACSGVQAYFDEAFAGMFLALIRGFIYDAVEKERNESGNTFKVLPFNDTDDLA